MLSRRLQRGNHDLSVMPLSEPTGWTRVFSEDFDVAYPVGSFIVGAAGTANDGRLLSSAPPYARYGSLFNFYPDDNFDTYHAAKYWPSKVVSTRTDVNDAHGVLDFWLHTETISGTATALSGWVRPITSVDVNQKLLYGRFSMRMRADPAVGYGAVMLLIGDNWPNEGEQDWPEGPLTDAVHGFYHYANASGGQQQVTPTGSPSWQDWHVYTIEWSNGRVKWFIDSTLVLDTTDQVSAARSKFVLQSGGATSTQPPTNAAGHLQVDWITYATWNG